MKKYLLIFFIVTYCVAIKKITAQKAISSFDSPTFSENLSGNSLGQYDNSVNLLNGQVNFTEPLASLSPKNGLNYTYSLFYNSEDVLGSLGKNFETTVYETGLGFSITDSRIVVDHKGTGSRLDDKFYLKVNGQISELIRTSDMIGTNVSFKVVNQPNIKCTYHRNFFSESTEYFTLEMPNGITQYFGVSNDAKGYLIKWGNWIGESIQTTGQERQVDTWMLSRVTNKLGDQINLHYNKAEETVGNGTLLYTRWIYLDHVIGPKGDQINFEYEDLAGYKDDYDPKVEYEDGLDAPRDYTGSDNDAYQEKYNMKRLSEIIKLDEFGELDKKITLNYNYYGSEVNVNRKSRLRFLNILDKHGFSKNYKEFKYNDNTSALIHGILYDNGKEVKYHYESKKLDSDHFGDDNVFTATSTSEESIILDGINYSIKFFKNNDTKAVTAEYIGFEGKWYKESIYSLGYSFGNLEDDLEVVLQDQRLAIMLRKSSSSQTRKLTLIKPNPAVRRDLIITRKNITNENVSDKPTLMSGDDFIAVGKYKGNVETFIDVKNSTEWNDIEITLPAGSFNYTGTNNYIISHNEDGEDIDDVIFDDVIRFHYLDQGKWDTKLMPLDVTPNTIDKSNWHASNGFAVAFLGGDKEYIYSWGEHYSLWDEQYSEFSRVLLDNEAFQDDAYFSFTNNSAIHMREKQNQYLPKDIYKVFNGVDWSNGIRKHTTDFTDQLFMGGQNYHLGVYGDGERKKFSYEYFQMEVFNKNTEVFEKHLLESNESFPDFPNYESEKDYKVVGIGGNYIIGQLIPNTYIEGADREIKFVFTFDNNAHRPYTGQGRFQELRVDDFLFPDQEIIGVNAKSQDHIISFELENSDGTKEFKTWVGKSILDNTFVSGGGIDGFGLNTLRDGDRLIYILREKRSLIDPLVNGEISSLIVDKVEMTDGDNHYFQNFSYHTAGAETAPNNLTFNFKNVSKHIENASEETGNGFTRYTIDLENSFNYGAIINTEIFDEDDTESPVASSQSSFSMNQIDILDESENLIASHTLPNTLTKSNDKDGFSTSSITTYNDRGLPNTVSTTYYDAKGDYHEKKVETIYAYEEYPGMANELLFSQVAMKSEYVDDELIERSVTTWADWGNGNWAPHKNFIWNGQGSGTFNDWGTSNPSSQYWKLTNEISLRDANLKVLESKDHNGFYSSTVYNNDDLPIARFSDASLNKVFADDFSSNDVANKWEGRYGSEPLNSEKGVLKNIFNGILHAQLPNDIDFNSEAYIVDFQLKNTLENEKAGFLEFVFGDNSYSYYSYYRVVFRHSDDKIQLYDGPGVIAEESFDFNQTKEWWQSVRIKIDIPNNSVKIFHNDTMILEYDNLGSVDHSIVGFNATDYNNMIIDNFRVYPSKAYASSYSYDKEDDYLVSELTEDNHIISHQVNDYGIEVSTTLETKQEIAGTSYASPANDLLPFGASISTAVMGKTFFKDEFQLDLSGEWTELDASNGVTTTWNVEDGQLIVENSGTPSSWGVDALVYELEEDITSGIVGVEFDYKTDGDASGWNFGVAMGNSDYIPTTSGKAFMFSAFSNSDRWRSNDVTQNIWNDITNQLEKNRTYRVKVVANLDTDQIYFYLDGHILKKEPFRYSGHDLRKISLFNYGRNPFRGIVDNFIVYADPVHSIQYSDAFGRPLQSQSEAVDGGVYVSETLYDEYGRKELTTKTTKVNAELSYNEGFVTGYNESNGELSGQVSINNNGDLYAYHATIKENSPLNRTIETGLSGEEFNVNSSSNTNSIEYNPDGISILGIKGMFRSNYYGQKTVNADGGEQMSLKNAIGQTIVTKTGKVPVTWNSTLITKDGNTGETNEINSEIYLTTSYEYDSKGNVVKVLPPAYYALPDAEASKEDYVSHYEYDHWGNVIREETPDKGVVKYHYDKDGKLQFRQNAKEKSNGKIRYWKYDAYDRITEIGFTDGNWSDLDFANQYEGIHRDYTTINIPPYRIRPMPEDEPIDLREPIPAFVANAETIIADHIVEPTDVVESVTYTASGSIVLKPGFHAQAGSEFTAKAKNVSALGQWKKRFHYTEEGKFTNSRDQIAKVEYNEDTNPDAEVTESFDYDKDGQVIAHHTEAAAWGTEPHTVEYEYNEKGELIAEHIDAGTTITYAYDMLGNLEKIGRPGDDDIFAKYEYDHNGALKKEVLANEEITSNYQYNSPGWITDIHHLVGDEDSPTHTFRQQLNYTDDGYGYYTGLIKRSSFTYTGSGSPSNYTYNYSYDKAMQLTRATNRLSSGNIMNITYDANRNIKTLDRGNAAEMNYEYNPGTNQLNSVYGTAKEYSYDAIGNVTKSPDIDEYQYDEYFNKATQLTRTNGTEVGITSFAYNGGGERIVKTDNYEGQEIKTVYIRGLSDYPVKEIYTNENGNSFVKYFVYGPSGIVATFGEDANEGINYILKDHLGSARLVVNSTTSATTVQTWYDYKPFGGSLRPNNAHVSMKYQFTGQENDEETGLYNYRARMYDTETGRFLGTDPQNQFFSPYVGIGNNPVNFVDPDGEFAFAPLLINLGIGFMKGLLANAGESFEDAANGNGTFSENFSNRMQYSGLQTGFSYNSGSGYQYSASNGYGGIVNSTSMGPSVFTGFEMKTVYQSSTWYYPETYRADGMVPSLVNGKAVGPPVHAPGLGSSPAQLILSDPYSYRVPSYSTNTNGGSLQDGFGDYLLPTEKHYNGSLGLVGAAVGGYNKIPNHVKRHYAHKLSKASGVKSGKIFQGTKAFANNTGKLASKLGPIGTALTVGVITYEVGTDTWDAHTIVNGTLLIGAGVATFFAAPVVLTGIAAYGIGDYFFDFSGSIDATVGRDSGIW